MRRRYRYDNELLELLAGLAARQKRPAPPGAVAPAADPPPGTAPETAGDPCSGKLPGAQSQPGGAGNAAQLVITGDGPLAEDLKRRTGAFRTGAGVVFTGCLQGEELAAAYASSDVFVFPSTTETFGNVVLEAMAAGLPVVAAAAGGVKNLVVDGCNGFVCRPRNAADLAAALLKSAADAPHRQKNGPAGPALRPRALLGEFAEDLAGQLPGNCRFGR